ncbi:MAG: hypothetical protein ABI679_06705 [Gemmatimonadota bacterium]
MFDDTSNPPGGTMKPAGVRAEALIPEPIFTNRTPTRLRLVLRRIRAGFYDRPDILREAAGKIRQTLRPNSE